MLTIALGSCLVQPEPAPVAAPDKAVPDESFAIATVTILDGEGFRADQDVWDGRIRAVGQALNLPDGFARVDGRGRALMPGLIDSHVHTFGTTLNDAIRFGVTSVLDQFTDPALAASKRAARATLAPGDEADLFSAGMLATAAGGHGTQVGTGMAVEPVRGPAEAASWAQARKAEGSDWTKIVYEDGVTYGRAIPSLERETIGALVGAAHAEGLLAVIHVSTLARALEAVELGADGLVHVLCSALVNDVQAARIAETVVFVVPTLSVVTAPVAEGRAARGEVAMENERHLHAVGVRLLAGTDVPNAGTASGISLHDELQLLVRAGLSGAEALAAATSMPATAFGIEDRGRIEAGRIADLVLVDGDLECDVSASTRIATIWKDGYRLERGLDEETSPPAARETTLVSDFEGWHRRQLRGRVAGDDGSATRRLVDRQPVGAGWGAAGGRRGRFGCVRVPVVGRHLLSRPAADAAGRLLLPGGSALQDPWRRPNLRGDAVRRQRCGRAPSVPFTAPEGWTEVEVPLARFPTATPGLIGDLSSVASIVPGTYAFELDDVEIR